MTGHVTDPFDAIADALCRRTFGKDVDDLQVVSDHQGHDIPAPTDQRASSIPPATFSRGWIKNGIAGTVAVTLYRFQDTVEMEWEAKPCRPEDKFWVGIASPTARLPIAWFELGHPEAGSLRTITIPRETLGFDLIREQLRVDIAVE